MDKTVRVQYGMVRYGTVRYGTVARTDPVEGFTAIRSGCSSCWWRSAEDEVSDDWKVVTSLSRQFALYD